MGKFLEKNKKIKIISSCELLVTTYLFLPYIVTTFNSTIRYFISNTHKLDTLFIYVLFLLLLLVTIKKLAIRINRWQIFFALCVIAVSLSSMFLSKNISTNITVIKDTCLSCIPALLLAGSIRDFRLFKDYLDRAARLTPYFLAYVVYILGVGTLDAGTSYSQSMSYYMLLPLIILAGNLIDNFSIKVIIPFFICFVMMLSYGARGPLACVAIFAVVKLLVITPKEKVKKRILVIGAILIIGVIAYVNFYAIIQYLIAIFKKAGFSVRALQRLLDKSFLEDRGRDSIFQCCISRITDNPFWGTGVVNDRIYITSHLYPGDDPLGNYPHNFFVEILMQYGAFIGSALIIGFLFLITKCLVQKGETESKDVVLVFIGVGFFPLLFSGSYIDSSDFFFLIGICGAVLQDKNYIMNRPLAWMRND